MLDFQHRRMPFVVRLISAVIIFSFLTTTILPPGYAQTIGLTLPLPGSMVGPSAEFVPVLLKGMTVHPENPLQFEFIIDSGHEKLKEEALKKESERLVKYFLASMTVPQNDLWVNLSPYEKDRIIPDELGKTELGRDLLSQDYILKQLTATLMYPEEELGKKFWDRMRSLAKKEYGVDEIPTDVFNKVWILPETATVYEYENTVYIVESKLKVMLEQDYFALQSNTGSAEPQDPRAPERTLAGEQVNMGTGELTKKVIKEIILPEIEKEVNSGKNFAPLRQIYHSLILAKWYKQTVKNSLMSQVYIDQNKTAGIALNDTQMKERIYDQYMQAYKKGVFNYIKEDYDALSQTVIPKQYFSGGFKDSAMLVGKTQSAAMVSRARTGQEYRSRVNFEPQTDAAMLTITAANDLLINAMAGSMANVKILASTDELNALLVIISLLAFMKYSPILFRGVIGIISITLSVLEQIVWTPLTLPAKIILAPFISLTGLGVSGVKFLWSTQTINGSIHRLQNDCSICSWKLAVRKLAKSRDARAIEPLKKVLFDQKILDRTPLFPGFPDKIRAEAARALGMFPSAKTDLFRVLSDPSIVVIQAAEESLNKIGTTHDEWFDSYIAALESTSEDAVKNAIEKLGDLGDPRAVDFLIAALSEFDKTAYSLLPAWTVALEELGDNRADETADSLLSAGAVALGKLGGSRAMEYLLKMFCSDIYEDAQESVKKLGGASHDQLVTAYIAALEAKSETAKINAAENLKELRDRRAVEPLIRVSSDKNNAFHEAVIEALGEVGEVSDKRVIKVFLTDLADHKNYEIAEEALKKLGFPHDQLVNEYFKLLELPTAQKYAAEKLIKFGLNTEQKDAIAEKMNKSVNANYNFLSNLLRALNDPRGNLIYIFHNEIGHYEDNAPDPYDPDLPKKCYVISQEAYWEGPVPRSASDQAMLAQTPVDLAENEIYLDQLNKFPAFDQRRLSSALHTGQISLATIKDARLSRFLKFLDENGLNDVVVMGGSVRDALLGTQVNDFDITVKVDIDVSDLGESASNLKVVSPQVIAQSERILENLSQALGVSKERLLDIKNPVEFEGVELTYLGPHRLKSGTLIRGNVFDKTTGRLSTNRTAPEILMLGLDANGRLYEYKEALQNWMNGVARLKGEIINGRNLWPLAILKLFRLRHEFGLAILKNDYDLAKKVLAEHEIPNDARFQGMVKTDIQKIIDAATDKDLARRELIEIGFDADMVNDSAMLGWWKASTLKVLFEAVYVKEPTAKTISYVRRKVSKLLTNPAYVEPAITLLNDPHPGIRRGAAEFLGGMGPIAKAAIPYLENVAHNDGTTKVELAAEKALIKIEGFPPGSAASQLSAIVEKLTSAPNPQSTKAKRDPNAALLELDALIEKLTKNPNPLVALEIAQLLNEVDDGPTVAAKFIPLLNDPHLMTQMIVLGALGAIGDPSALDAIVELTNRETDLLVLSMAIEGALGRINDPRSAQAILHILKRVNNSMLAMKGALALRQLGAVEAIPDLEQLLDRFSSAPAELPVFKTELAAIRESIAALKQLQKEKSRDSAMLASVTQVAAAGLIGAFIQSQALAARFLGETANDDGFSSWFWETFKTHPILSSGAVLAGAGVLYGIARWYWLTQTVNGNIHRLEEGESTEKRLAKESAAAYEASVYTQLLEARALININNKTAIEKLSDVIKSLKMQLSVLESDIASDEQTINENEQRIRGMKLETVIDEIQDQSYFGASSTGGWHTYPKVVYSPEDQDFIDRNDTLLKELESKIFNRDRLLGTIAELEKTCVDLRNDSAMLNETPLKAPGGIDMNDIAVDRANEEGAKTIQFEMEGMEPLLNMDIQGFSPIIIDMVPINSVLPLLGLAPTEKGIKYGKEEADHEMQVSLVAD